MDTPPINEPPAVPPTPPPSSDPSTRQWTVILHLSALSGLVVPFGNILAPLIIWLLKKVELPALDPVGKDVLNFQITYAIYAVASVIIAMVASCLIIPIILPVIVGIAWLVFTILGGVKASNGETYVFPGVIKLIK